MSRESNPTKAEGLSLLALFSLIFGSIMGGGVFDIPQNIGHQAGLIAVSLAWVITGVGMLVLSGAFIYITYKRPDIKSGIYGYAKYGFGDYFGFNVAWGYWLNALLGNASYLVYTFATLGNFAVFKYFGNGITLTALIGESVCIWVVYLIIISGIKTASFVNIAITSIKLLALISIVLIFTIGFNFIHFKANFKLEPQFGSTFTQIKSTMLVTVWDFLGIEAACIYAIRAKDMKDVARATFFGIIMVLIIDVLISILPYGILSAVQISNLSTPSTAGIVSYITGGMTAQIIRVGIIISVMGAFLAWTMLATNIFYLAASDGTLSQTMAKVNKKTTPSNALLVSIITTQIFIICAYFTNSVYLDMIQLATSLVLLPYLLSAMYALKLAIFDAKFDFISWVKGSLAVIYSIWLIYAGGLKYLLFSAILYVLGLGFYIMARRENQAKIFTTQAEGILCLIIVIIAITSVVLWIKGYISL